MSLCLCNWFEITVIMSVRGLGQSSFPSAKPPNNLEFLTEASDDPFAPMKMARHLIIGRRINGTFKE